MSSAVKRLSVLALAGALAAPTAGDPAPAGPATALGVIEGTVQLEPPPPPRRRAQRYPAGQAEVHAVQELPAVVYLVGAVPGGSTPAAQPAVMTQRDTTFAPSLVHVSTGGTVTFPNGDPFFHNVFSYSSAQRFDLGRYPQGESKSVTFDEPGVVEVFCEVHDFMRGAVVVAENPFHAIVDSDGSFRIAGVPEGEHTVAFWQQDHAPVEVSVVVVSGQTTRVDVELER